MRERQKHRLEYLKKIYEISEGGYRNPIPQFKAGEELGFSEILSSKVEHYLVGDGLIEYFASVGDGRRGVWITHEGIVEAEKYIDLIEKKYDYEVVLSFAGEKRDYVEKVAKILSENKVKVFYDGLEDEIVELWGKELPEVFEDIYGGNARYCVMFISKEYAEKIWTNEERRSAISKAIKANNEYILPARFDDTKIPGIRETVSYIDLSKYSHEDLGRFILKKLGISIEKNELES